jgi:uncharacterized protein (DUF1800 family)
MTVMTPSTTSALIAATRFGFAPRPGELDKIAPDPRGWALRQLTTPPRPLAGDLPTAAAMLALTMETMRQKKAPEDRKDFQAQMRAVILAEIEARVAAAATSDTPLLERLTYFWGNHFTVSGFRPIVRGAAGAFEREAIRPHVAGRFIDMLLAVERHPAMLLYLDNAMSIGPDSMVGRRLNKGINENLGREILELHTLGVDGGYTQQDVEALARILTGWSVARPNEGRFAGLRPGFDAAAQPGGFFFRERAHEPGPKTLLGRRYAEAGAEEGVAALRDLAAHPATARHIATKLARHFIADRPLPDAVKRIAQIFTSTGGDLAKVTAAVIAEETIWQTPFAKLRTPSDLVISACRITGFAPPAPLLANSLRMLDQPAFLAPQPSGWPDDAASWASPEAVLRRAEWCETFANRMLDPPEPMALAASALGEALPEESLQAIRTAPSQRMALALLLASPEFQKR